MTGAENLSGEKFGRWTAIHPVEPIKVSASYMCRCECGTVRSVFSKSLRSGKSKSCGCLRASNLPSSPKPGARVGTREYNSWRKIKLRCFNKNCPEFRTYGARGITMDDKWRASFYAFLADVGPAPTRHHTIDRIDNDKGYFKENCRWSTARVQARNRRSNSKISAFGETKLLCEWAEDPRCAVNIDMIQQRIAQYNWSPEAAISRPSLRRGARADPSVRATQSMP